jgi:transposase
MAAREGSVTRGGEEGTFVVIDIRDQRRLLVDARSGMWLCSCAPSPTASSERCDHVWAVHFTIEAQGSPEAVGEPTHRRTYSQPDWRTYRKGLEGENRWFEPLLLQLLETVQEPARPPGRAGRPRTPIREALFITMTKAHEVESLSAVHGRLSGLAAQGKISGTTNYSLPARILGREDLTPVLLQLVRDSAKPMIPFELGGTLAIDSSGFTTSVFGAYLTETHEPDRRHEFVKAHCAVGTRTHIVTDVVVTEQNHADSPEFAGLLERTIASGFHFSTVVADKAYLSRAHYALGAALGLRVLIDFRSNTGPKPKGVPAWREAWHLKHDDPEEFGRGYHQRSNVESTFSSIKRRQRESLFSRRPVARRNELICKILVHNLTVVIQKMYEREIDPSLLFPAAPEPLPEEPIGPDWTATQYENIVSPVKESVPPEG